MQDVDRSIVSSAPAAAFPPITSALNFNLSVYQGF